MKHTRPLIRRAHPLRALLTIAALLVAVVYCGRGQYSIMHDSGDARLSVTVMPGSICTPLGKVDTILVISRNNALKSLLIHRYRMEPRQGPSNPFIMREDVTATLIPRASRIDTIFFDASRVPIGQYAAHIDIDRTNGHTDYTVYAEVSPPAVLAVDSLLAFASDGPGDSEMECLGIVNPSCDTLIVTGLSVPPPFRIAPSTKLPDTLVGRERAEICVQYMDTAGPGPARDVRGTLRVTMADGSVIPATLHAHRAPRPLVEAEPERIVFIGVQANSIGDTVAHVLVVNHGNQRDTLQAWDVASQEPGAFIVTAPPLPARLNPDEAETLDVAIRFAPRDPGLYIGRLALRFARTPGPVVVELRGNAVAGMIAPNDRQIDLGNVFTGDSVLRADTLRLINAGARPVDVTGITFNGRDSTYFVLIGDGSRTIPPGGDLAYDITFKPDAAREYETDATIRLSNGGRVPVKIRGRGATRPPEIRMVWIDSTRSPIPVNELFTLTAHIAPDLVPGDNLTTFRLICRVDHHALYPRGPVTPNGARDTLYYRSADTVVIERLAGPVILGGDLVGINFEGLVTGQAENTVELVDVQFPGRALSLTTGNGNATLEGCDVGNGLGFNRPIAARSAWPQPARGDVTISYVSPDGSRPWVRLVDALGRSVRDGELPPGNGGVQTTTVDTRGLGSGIYFVELHAAGEMSVVKVVVGEF